jgi:hypothetical protein
LFFPFDSTDGVPERFIIDEFDKVIFLCETLYKSLPVFIDSFPNIVRYPRIKHSVSIIGHYVNYRIELSCVQRFSHRYSMQDCHGRQRSRTRNDFMKARASKIPHQEKITGGDRPKP